MWGEIGLYLVLSIVIGIIVWEFIATAMGKDERPEEPKREVEPFRPRRVRERPDQRR